MKNLTLLLTALILTGIQLSAQEDLSAIGEYEEWDQEVYKRMLEKNEKIYIYPDGTYLKTRRLLKESPKVAALLLGNRPTKIEADQKGRLSDDMMKELLSQREPFDPVKAIATPPCCPVYDKNGRVLYSTWPPAGCPSTCYRWIRIKNKNYKFSCCPPSFINNWEVLFR